MFNRDNITLLVALIFSVGLHVSILPLVYKNNNTMSFTPPTKIIPTETLSVEEAEIDLGIDESRESTLTWIGYGEYEEQLARHAEVEQAEMNSEIASASATAKTITQLAQPVMEMTTQFLEALRTLIITIPSRELQPIKHETPKEVTVQPIERPAEENQVKIVSSDRDSEATSIIHVLPEDWTTGKPLAAQGIVLKPKKPKFLPTQLVASRPGNIVADLHFDQRGKPLNVVILLGTGSASINRTIENSLYRWRASGDQIDAIEGEGTVKITIHILFSR